MKEKFKGLIIGLAVGSMLTGATAYAANGTSIKALMQQITLYVDGTKKATTNVIYYNNTTYVPARVTSNALGKDISLQGTNLYLGKQPTTKVTEEEAVTLVYKKIKKDADKYKLHFMIDDPVDNYYVIRAYEDMETHIATYGWYYVDRYTGDVYKYDVAEVSLEKI